MGKTKEEDYDRFETTYGTFGDIRKYDTADEAKKEMKRLLKEYAEPGKPETYDNYVNSLIDNYHEKKHKEYVEARDAGNLDELTVSFGDFNLDADQMKTMRELIDNAHKLRTDQYEQYRDFTKGKKKKLYEDLSRMSDRELDALTRRSEAILPKELNDKVKAYKTMKELGYHPSVVTSEVLGSREGVLQHYGGKTKKEIIEERKRAQEKLAIERYRKNQERDKSELRSELRRKLLR